MEEPIEILKNIRLTERDFDLIIQGLEFLPNKDSASDLLCEMLAISVIKDEDERAKHKVEHTKFTTARDREKYIMIEDSKILQGKLLMLKRVLCENNIINEANSISNHKVD